MTKKVIAVIGGTGKSGKYLIGQLLAHNYKVRALVRDATKLGDHRQQVDVIEGDVCNDTTLTTLMQGCDAVISTLGQPQGGPPIFSNAAEHILRAMAHANIQRYIVVTGLSIDIPGDAKGERTQQASAYMRTTYPAIIADKQREYTVLTKSSADWTLARLPLIIQTDQRHGVTINETDCAGDKISATDLADFLIAQLDDTHYIRKAPFVASQQ